MVGFEEKKVDEVYTSLKTSQSGLTEKEALQRLRAFGLNTLIQKDRFKILKTLFSAFLSPLNLLLLAASFVSALLGDITDFLIILTIVIASGLIGFYQHFKADIAVEKLKKKTHLTAIVLRDGIEKQVPFIHITVGDVVMLSSGNMLPADLRFISTKDLAIDEAILTGESLPVEKGSNPIAHTTEISKKSNMGFSGTHVVSGEGIGVVVAIGRSTEFGKLSKQITITKPPTTFDRDIAQFSVLIVQSVAFLSAFVFLVVTFHSHNPLESLIFAVALAVGLTPEMMPVVVTIALSHGALKMEAKEVIVKYLPSIQNLGSMNILCTDKTGTLTEGTVKLIGYHDILGKSSESVLTASMIHAHFDQDKKNPLSTAVLEYPYGKSLNVYKKVDDLPFDFQRKCSSVVVKAPNHYFMFTRGTAYSVIEKSSHILSGMHVIDMTSSKKKKLMEEFENLSKQGIRVLGVAQKKIRERDSYTIHDEKDLIFLGYLLYEDPLKKTVKQTVQELANLGIEIKILTGDNEFVTQHVCSQTGVFIKGTITGEMLDKLTDTVLLERVNHTTIFARLNPEQKGRVIDTLKKQKMTVGYMGDGVNDAPPLKHADVGISVNTGADIARDVADIVLLQKNLHTLKEGVIEGRKTHENIFKFIIMSISSNFGNMITVAAASLFLPFLPMLPIQILLLAFLYDLTQITIPTDTIDVEFTLKPQKWDLSFIRKCMIVFGPASSIFDFVTIFVLLYLFHYPISLFRTGWFVESLLTQTLIVFILRTKRVPFFKSIPSGALILSCLLGLVFGLWLPFSPVAHYFSFLPLPLLFFGIVTIIVLAYITLVEIIKVFFYSVSDEQTLYTSPSGDNQATKTLPQSSKTS